MSETLKPELLEEPLAQPSAAGETQLQEYLHYTYMLYRNTFEYIYLTTLFFLV